MPSRRLDQLNVQLREEISDLIRREVRDPGLPGIVSITSVDISPDLRHARVYVSALGGDEERNRAVAALQRAAGFIRHGLGERLTLRYIPELTFRPDVSIERGERIMGLLRDIARESPAAAEPGSEAAPGSPTETPRGEDEDQAP
jgi:ribosome-binding factor A